MAALPFRILCLTITGILAIYGFWKYNKNQSISLVDFKTYHATEKDIYPSISLCFEGEEIYDHEKLKKDYAVENVWDYINYLQGDIWNDNMAGINYDEVTMNLEKYVLQVELHVNTVFSDPAYQYTFNQSTPGVNNKRFYPFFTSFRQALTKCFTFDISEKMPLAVKGKIVKALDVSFENLSSLNMNLGYNIHYPSQLHRAVLLDYEYKNEIGIMSGNVKTKILYIGTVEIIRRRDTSKDPCNADFEKDDANIYSKLVGINDCKPPHWLNVNHPIICNTSEKMKQVYFGDGDFRNPRFLNRFDRPCDQVQTLAFNFQESQRSKNETRDLESTLFFVFKDPEYKEIVHIKSFNLEGLVGNVGGYIGLFLGFAIWNIPDFVDLLFNYFKQ